MTAERFPSPGLEREIDQQIISEALQLAEDIGLVNDGLITLYGNRIDHASVTWRPPERIKDIYQVYLDERMALQTKAINFMGGNNALAMSIPVHFMNWGHYAHKEAYTVDPINAPRYSANPSGLITGGTLVEIGFEVDNTWNIPSFRLSLELPEDRRTEYNPGEGPFGIVLLSPGEFILSSSKPVKQGVSAGLKSSTSQISDNL